MMTLSQGALNASQAETYFEQHYSHDDYYSESHQTVGPWIGKGSADLGARRRRKPRRFLRSSAGHSSS
jgi:hypothetical protein